MVPIFNLYLYYYHFRIFDIIEVYYFYYFCCFYFIILGIIGTPHKSTATVEKIFRIFKIPIFLFFFQLLPLFSYRFVIIIIVISNVFIIIIILISLFHFCPSDTHERNGDYCDTEVFSPQCPPGMVVLVGEAR